MAAEGFAKRFTAHRPFSRSDFLLHAAVPHDRFEPRGLFTVTPNVKTPALRIEVDVLWIVLET